MIGADGSPPAEQARAAYARRDWREAYDLLSAAAQGSEALGADDLWRLAVSAYLVGEDGAYETALERIHRECMDGGDAPGAARAAVWLGLHLAEQGEMARASGWFGRAGRLLEDHAGDCVEEGYLLLPTGIRHLATGEYETAAEVAAEAAEFGQRFRDRDLFALAVHLRGRALLRRGRVAEGLALLDEAMVAVTTEELSPQVAGMVYCSVISACRRVYALDRAHEWTAALAEWCEAQPDMVAFRGRCRVFRSELMRLQGAWREAMAEAERVGEGDPWSDVVTGAACYEQGEVHRLRGEWAAAEASYQAAGRAGREPQPGLALLRLAQGDVEVAATAIKRALHETDEGLLRARLLPAFVEIMLERDDPEGATDAAEELAAIAERYDTSALRTMAAQARGTVALARGRAEAALASLREAWQGWRELDAPHDGARARELLGRACLALGDEEAAGMELDAARTVFDELGAAPDVDRVDRLRAGGPPEDTHGLTPRELEVLAHVATGKTNKAIAEALYISEKTVARHVSNIFRKLGLSSRAAATAYAYEHGLT